MLSLLIIINIDKLLASFIIHPTKIYLLLLLFTIITNIVKKG